MKLSVTFSDPEGITVEKGKVSGSIYVYDERNRVYTLKKGFNGNLVLQCMAPIKISLDSANSIEIESEEMTEEERLEIRRNMRNRLRNK